MTALIDVATALSIVLQEAITDPAASNLYGPAAAALAVGLAAIGTGYAQRGIGSAAVGAVAEDDEMFVNGLIFTVIPETLIIIAFITIFLVGQ